MQPFAYERARDVDGALAAVGAGGPAAGGGVKFLAGGTNLLDLMKEGIERPATVIDLNRLPLAQIESLPDGGLRIGALARNSDMADHAQVRERYPLLTQALVAGASPQLRNLATAGGNLLQRTRCHYFYDPVLGPCNKREPGSGCSARDGFNRMHAILGASEACVATHPSDMAVALAALDAVVRVRSASGQRTIPIADFHRLPGHAPERDTTLAADELVLSIDLPASPFARHAHYLKVRDRASYAFALVSAAVALDLEGDRVRGARIALGGVAHKPWRVPEAEAALVGQPLSEATMRTAADALLRGAQPLRENGFKVELAKRTVVRALAEAREARA